MIKNIDTKDVPNVDLDAPLTMPLDDSTQYDTGVTPKNKFLYIFGFLVFLVVIALTCGALFYYLVIFKNDMENKSLVVVENKVAQVPVKTFDKTSVAFEVLNGSGVAGEAKKAGDDVQGIGYRVIKMGNAEKTVGNKLYLDKSTQEFSNQIITDLANFNISSVSGELTDSTASARLIIGTK